MFDISFVPLSSKSLTLLPSNFHCDNLLMSNPSAEYMPPNVSETAKILHPRSYNVFAIAIPTLPNP